MQKELAAAEMLAMVVCLRPEEGKYPRDCVAVFATSAEDDGGLLQEASGFKVLVFDVRRRERLRESIGRRVGAFLKRVWPQVGVAVDVAEMPTPGGVAPNECCLACLGALLGAVASGAELEVDVPAWVASARFVSAVGRQVRLAFEGLRGLVEESECRDVLQTEAMSAVDGCQELLEGLTAWGAGAEGDGGASEGETAGDAGVGASGVVRVADGVSVEVSRVVVDDLVPVSVLTWNVDAAGKSRSAPASFTVVDKAAAVQLEVLRWRPEVVSLQECAEGGAMEALSREKYEFVGAAAAHRGFVHLYVKRGVRWGRGQAVQGAPGVVAEVEIGGQLVCVAAVHLEPGAEGAARRREQAQRVLAAMWGQAVVVLGDLNVREAEVEALSALWEDGLEDVRYTGSSWDMRENGYYEEYKGQGRCAPAMSFDRILLGGCVCAAGYLVGQARCFAEEAVFALSDHYGVMALVDVHAAHASAGGSSSRLAGRRREALGLARDQAASRERVVAKELGAAAERGWKMKWRRGRGGRRAGGRSRSGESGTQRRSARKACSGAAAVGRRASTRDRRKRRARPRRFRLRGTSGWRGRACRAGGSEGSLIRVCTVS